MFIHQLKDGPKTHFNITVEEALAKGVSQATIDAHFAGIRLEAIKVECRRRVNAVADNDTRVLISTLAATIGSKSATARTDAEKATLIGAEKGSQWSMQMMETIATLAADPSADFTDDAAWPECPREAVAVYSQF